MILNKLKYYKALRHVQFWKKDKMANTYIFKQAYDDSSIQALKLFNRREDAYEEYNSWVKIFNLPYKSSYLVEMSSGIKDLTIDNFKYNFLLLSHYPLCLKDFLEGNKTKKFVYNNAIDITHAVKEVHEAGMAHQNINPENILLSSEHRAAL